MVNIPFSAGRQKVAAIVDVSPGNALVTLASIGKNAPATVLSSARSALSLEDRSDDQERGLIPAQIREAAEMSLRSYTAAGLENPILEAYVVLHAPWAQSSIQEVHEHFEEDVRVSEGTLAGLAKRSLSLIKDLDASRLAECAVLGVALNGYETPEPEGKFAHQVRLISIASECDAQLRSSILGSLQQLFPVARILWRSALRANLVVARTAGLQGPLLVVDMGVDETHIASIYESKLEQLVVPEGIRTILSRVAAGRSPEKTLGFIRMLDRDACSTEDCDALKQAIATAEPELVRIFGEAMAKIGTANKVPNNVLIITHPDLESWISAFLSRIDFAQFTITSLPLVVHTPSSLNLSQYASSRGFAGETAVALVNIESQ